MANVELGTDEYEDLVEIGRGGFGVVYRAYQRAFNRTVAIKLITEVGEDTRRRFNRERRAIGVVSSHPNIPEVYASGFTPAGLPYIVMAFTDRGSLGDRLRESGPLGSAEVTRIAVRLSGALESAHRAGVLHRDVKPENVLVSAFDEPQLADFGIASVLGATRTTSGVITASIAYAAPEILDGQRPSVASDVYSLGATIFTLVHGRPPFMREGDESLMPVIARTFRDPVPDLRQNGIPGAFCDVIERAMNKTAGERFPSAEALGQAMQNVQRGLREPVTDMHVLAPGGSRVRGGVPEAALEPTLAPSEVFPPPRRSPQRPPRAGSRPSSPDSTLTSRPPPLAKPRARGGTAPSGAPRVRGTRSRWLAVSVVVVALIAAGLAFLLRDRGQSVTVGEGAVAGGTLVLAAEQEPDCADWIGSCSGSSWGYWVMGSPTLPRAFDVNADSHYVPGPALAGEPQLDKGPPQKVTYKFKSDAVWSDGQPITSHDIKYTWDQIAHGNDIYDKTGYEKIKDVDDKDPRVAVVTFSEPYAAWKDLFGAFYGILPSHLLEGKDRSALTKNGYTWSGGPWIIDHWTKGQEVKLVPNPKYFGEKPNLDAVVFKFITDTSAEFQAYKTGQALGGYPQPQIGGESQLKSATDINFKPSEGLSYEGLWFNAEKPPLNEKAVRQALGYATDREAIVGQINKPYKPDSVVLQSFFPPGIDRKFAKNSYEKYTRDLKKVDELMTGAGWKKGADGIWAKGGQKASLTISTTAGNKAREIVEQLIQSQWKEAGFDLKTNNTKAGTLFGEWLPKGTFQVAMYAQVPSPDPGQCVIWCGKNVPGPNNNNSGQNFTRLKSPALDKAWDAADSELDESKRADLTKAGIDALADEVPALPLYSKLTIVVWSRTIGGPVDDDFTLGPFWNMQLWFLKK